MSHLEVRFLDETIRLAALRPDGTETVEYLPFGCRRLVENAARTLAAPPEKAAEFCRIMPVWDDPALIRLFGADLRTIEHAVQAARKTLLMDGVPVPLQLDDTESSVQGIARYVRRVLDGSEEPCFARETRPASGGPPVLIASPKFAESRPEPAYDAHDSGRRRVPEHLVWVALATTIGALLLCTFRHSPERSAGLPPERPLPAETASGGGSLPHPVRMAPSKPLQTVHPSAPGGAVPRSGAAATAAGIGTASAAAAPLAQKPGGNAYRYARPASSPVRRPWADMHRRYYGAARRQRPHGGASWYRRRGAYGAYRRLGAARRSGSHRWSSSYVARNPTTARRARPQASSPSLSFAPFIPLARYNGKRRRPRDAVLAADRPRPPRRPDLPRSRRHDAARSGGCGGHAAVRGGAVRQPLQPAPVRA